MSQAFMKFLKIIFRFIADGVIEIGFRLQSTSTNKFILNLTFRSLGIFFAFHDVHRLKKSYALTVKESFQNFLSSFSFLSKKIISKKNRGGDVSIRHLCFTKYLYTYSTYRKKLGLEKWRSDGKKRRNLIFTRKDFFTNA